MCYNNCPKWERDHCSVGMCIEYAEECESCCLLFREVSDDGLCNECRGYQGEDDKVKFQGMFDVLQEA